MFGSETHETTETHEFDRPSSLAVETTNGSLTLTAHDESNVVVEAHKRGDSERELANARVVAGGTDPLSVEVERDGGSDATVSLTVAVPTDLPIERAATTNGSVEATGVTLRGVETTNGGVELTDTTGPLSVSSTNGGVTVDGVDGDAELSTTNGGVEVSSVDGTVTAETDAGSITVREAAAIGDVRTRAGKIDAVVRAIDGDTAVESTAGSVRLRAGPELDAEVRVSSSVGGVTAPGLSGSDGIVGGAASGQVGDGGPTLTVSTQVGSVAFEQ